MGCLTGMFTLPIAFFNWVRENGVKGYIVAGLLFFGIMISLLAIQNSIKNTMYPEEPTISEQASTPGPSRSEAPYRVETDTRIYYALIAIVNKDDTVTMSNYYELSRGEWSLTEGTLVLDENYGNIRVTKRALHE